MFAKRPRHSVQDTIMHVLVSRGYSPDNGDAERNSFLNMNAFTWQLDFLCKSDGVLLPWLGLLENLVEHQGHVFVVDLVACPQSEEIISHVMDRFM